VVHKNLNILFTGATSFAGQAFYADLKQAGENVVAVSRQSLSDSDVTVDLSVEGAEKRLPNRDFDLLIHFASFVPLHERSATWEECAPTNVYGTLRLLRWAKGRVSRIMLASSCAVYGPGHAELPIREEAPLHPETFYGITKYSQEQLVSAFCAVEKISLVILRIGYVYGPGLSSRRAVIKLLQKIQAGERIEATTGTSPALPLIHTKDLSYIGKQLLQRYNGVYNVSASRAISVVDYAEAAMSVLGKKSPVEHPPVVNAQDRWYSIEKLKMTCGIEPRVTLREGIETLLQEPPA
jgi:nucleoside-diphosphate-sugar epimerase